MANQIVISSGAKVRNLNGVLTGTTGVVNSLGINVANGIPQLDGSGKILVSQLPNSVMEYKGTWNAATNTPTLVNGTGNQGDVYLCNVAGTVNFGAGAITFAVGDQAIYSGTIWQKAGGSTGTVTSVAVTETGDALTITGSPITTSGTINIGFAGISSQYVNGAGGLTTFPSLAGYVTAVTGTAPVVSSGGTTPAISMPVATASVDGYLDNADWTTFNNKQNAITLTTTGTSGAATLIGATLNIPNYSTDLSGYVPYTGATANVNLGTFDLTADIITGATGSFTSSGSGNTLTINHSSGSGHGIDITKGGSGEGIRVNKTSGSGNAVTIIGTLNATTLVKDGGTYLTTSSAASTYVPYTGATTNVDLGIYNMSAAYYKSTNGYVMGQGSTVGLSGAFTVIGATPTSLNIVISNTKTFLLTFPSTSRTYTYPDATGTLALTSDLSSYIQGSGTTNYVPKFTASGTIGNSLIYDTGTRIAIGGTSATYGVLTVQSDAGQFCIQSNTTPGKQLQIGYDHVANNSYLSSLNQGVAFTPLFLQPNGGNVGVGTTTDNGARFQVTGTSTFSGSVTFGSDLFTYANGGIFFSGAATYTSGIFQNANGLNLQSGGSPRLTITSGGNVGIYNTLYGINNVRSDGGYGGIDFTNTGVGYQYSAKIYTFKTSAGVGEFYGFTNDYGAGTSGQLSMVAKGDSSANLGFYSGTGGERMRITGGGLVGIGNTGVGTVRLAVTGENQSSSNYSFISYDSAGNPILVCRNDKALFAQGVYDFTTGSGANVVVFSDGSMQRSTSSLKYKKNVENYTKGLAEVMQMRPVTYNSKNEKETQTFAGFIAEEIHDLGLAEFVQYAEDESPDALSYGNMVSLLVNAIQELKAEIDELKNK